MLTIYFTQVPIIIPMLVLTMSIILFMTPLLNEPKPQYLIGLLFVFSAFLIYIPFVYQKKRYSIAGTLIIYII